MYIGAKLGVLKAWLYVSITRPGQKMFIIYKNLAKIILLKKQLLSEILYLCLGTLTLMGRGKPFVT